MVKAYRNIRIKKENRMAGEREAEGKKWNAQSYCRCINFGALPYFTLYTYALSLVCLFLYHLRALTNASIHGVTSSLWMRFSG